MHEAETAIMSGRLALLYRTDGTGRLLDSNEPYGTGKPAPLAHMCVGRDLAVFAVRGGLTSPITDQLCASLAQIRPVADLQDRSIDELVWEAVRDVPGVTRVRSGPVFTFPEGIDSPAEVVRVDPTNADMLTGAHVDTVPELPFVQPCFAKVLDDQSVSICHTVRINGPDREAGVDTLSDHRRRGYGTEVVAAWGRAVLDDGLLPTYSTNWDNNGSIGIAGRLKLLQIGVEMGIE